MSRMMKVARKVVVETLMVGLPAESRELVISESYRIRRFGEHDARPSGPDGLVELEPEEMTVTAEMVWAAAYDAAWARLDPACWSHFPSLVVPGVMMLAFGSAMIASDTHLHPGEGGLSGSQGYTAIAVTLVALAVAFAHTKRVPARWLSVIGLLVAAAVAGQALTGEVILWTDLVTYGSMIVAAIALPAAWLPLITYRDLKWGGLADRVSSRRTTRLTWICLAIALVGIAVGDALTTFLDPSIPLLARGGLTLNALGALLIATGIRETITIGRRPIA